MADKMAKKEIGVFSFDEEVPPLEDFQYCTKGTPEPKLLNNRVRGDNESLFSFVADIDLSKEYTSDEKNIGDILSDWVKG